MMMSDHMKSNSMGAYDLKAKMKHYGIDTKAARDTYQDDVLCSKYGTFDAAKKTHLVDNWERALPNKQKYFENSPVAVHSHRNGDLSPDRYAARTFNRKMKMRDTFTRILPNYSHIKTSCYQKAASHILHQNWEKNLEDKPMHNISRVHTKKFDPMKVYSEEMRKLGTFAPQPRQGGPPKKVG